MDVRVFTVVEHMIQCTNTKFHEDSVFVLVLLSSCYVCLTKKLTRFHQKLAYIVGTSTMTFFKYVICSIGNWCFLSHIWVKLWSDWVESWILNIFYCLTMIFVLQDSLRVSVFQDLSAQGWGPTAMHAIEQFSHWFRTWKTCLPTIFPPNLYWMLYWIEGASVVG